MVIHLDTLLHFLELLVMFLKPQPCDQVVTQVSQVFTPRSSDSGSILLTALPVVDKKRVFYNNFLHAW